MVGDTAFAGIQVGSPAGAHWAARLAADGREGMHVLTLEEDAAQVGLAPGDYLFISDNSNNAQVAQVRSSTGSTVVLGDPLFEDFLVARQAAVSKLTPLRHIRLSDFTLDGSANRGNDANGIRLSYVVESEVSHVQLRGTSGAAIYLETGYQNRLSDVTVTASGSANQSDVELRRQTRFQVVNLTSLAATGFGPQFAFSNGGQVTNLISSNAQGRGLKLQRTAYTQFVNVQVSGTKVLIPQQSGFTGISVTQGSHRNLFANCVALQNGHAGIWLEGKGDDFNQFVNCISKYNHIRDIEIGQGAIHNTFLALASERVLDRGTQTIIIGAGQTSPLP